MPQVMRSSTKLGKIFLTAMVHELYKTGMGETTFEKVSFEFSGLCFFMTLSSFAASESVKICRVSVAA